MAFSNYTSQALLNSLFGNTSSFGALASAPTVYVALFTAAPNVDGTGGTEVTGGDYARVQTAASDWGNATSADPSVLQNAEPIEFPEATDAWGTVTHFALYDDPTAGNLLTVAELNASKAPTSGDVPRFAAGELSVTLT